MEQTTEPFGKVLHRERKAQRISQVELANALGVSQPTIGKWERGESEPRFSELAQIFKALKRDFDFFLGRTDNNSVAIQVSGPIQNVVGNNSNNNEQSISLTPGGGASTPTCPECARKEVEIVRLTRECERLSRECERAAAGVK